MKIISQYLLTSVLLLNSYCFAQWISLDDNSLPDSPPVVKLISDDISGTVIKIDLPGFRINEFNSQGKTYHSINIGSEAITSKVGFPEIPHIAKMLAIPDLGTMNVEVLETSKSQIVKGVSIPPARESWIEGKPETPFIENIESYSSSNIYPAEIVSIEEPSIFRDLRITRVSIYPIRYFPVKKEIEVYSSITIRINYIPGAGANQITTSKKSITPSFHKIYKSSILNYDQVLERKYGGRVDGHDIMLCIMPDIYIEEFQPYAEWKNKSGTEIFITKFSEIGATQSDPQPIKDHIQNVYNNWLNPPTHILLVGDYGTVTNCVPRKRITLDGWTFATEDWFVELAGNDYFPEMMIGRFTHHATGGEARLQIMVDKFIKYEKYPAVTGNDWYKKGIVCSNNAYQSQIETKRETAQEMMLYGNFISVDTMMSVYPSGCNYYLPDVISAINNGRSYLNYRGEGWSYGWWANCYSFETSDVSTLTNYNKLTFVTSIGCGVAMFDNNVQCFGEEWIEMGSVGEDPKGGCAFIGPTSNTHTAQNNWIDRGIYVGMFEEGMDSPGEALLRGKLLMYQVFGGSEPYVEYHYKIYCMLGDPSLHVWKDLPRTVTVVYPDTITVGNSQVQITVTDSISGLPVSNGRICISGNDVYEIDTTNANGLATLNINPLTVGQFNLTVCGGNVKPYEGVIEVIDDQPTTFQHSVSVSDGWNMVSIPGLHPDDQNVDTWWEYRDFGANVFRYSSGYQAVSTLVPGEGYWMKHSGSRVYNTGEEWPSTGIQVITHEPLNGIAGWNLIGCYENIVPTSGLTTNPPGLIDGPVYVYLTGYQVATTLDPGYGYWTKLSGAGQIFLPDAMTKASEPVEWFKEDWGRITFTDAAGKNLMLYMVNGKVNLEKYELPPLPPQGMFDIRYNSGRIAEDINNSFHKIDLRGVTYPLTVRVENISLLLKDETGKVVNENLKDGQEIVIYNTTINKLIVSGELIPDTYGLEQNYPNPFNPFTKIKYSVPVDGLVKIFVFNTLGEEVAEIVNRIHTAGKYEITFDASDISSGVYLYRMQVGEFISAKKMIILK